MRILHVANHCGKANGNVNVAVDIACCQVAQGHAVAFASSGGDFNPLMEGLGVKIFHVEQPHHGFIPVKLPMATYGLWSAIFKFRPDVVHLHMAAHNLAMQPLRMFGVKTVTTVHNEFDKSVPIMGWANRVISVSDSGAKAMQKRGVPPSHSRIVLNGPINSARLSKIFEMKELRKPAIISVCGLHDRKGVADLVEAFAIVHKKIPDANLYILGEGPQKDKYTALAEQLGVTEFIDFAGFQSDPRPYLYSSDVFVLASHADPGPLVIAEARRAGLAIVATAVDGIPQMLDFGAAGKLIPPRQPEELAKNIIYLLENPEALKEMRLAAKSNTDRFTIERVCSEIETIYTEMMGD